MTVYKFQIILYGVYIYKFLHSYFKCKYKRKNPEIDNCTFNNHLYIHKYSLSTCFPMEHLGRNGYDGLYGPIECIDESLFLMTSMFSPDNTQLFFHVWTAAQLYFLMFNNYLDSSPTLFFDV